MESMLRQNQIKAQELFALSRELKRASERTIFYSLISPLYLPNGGIGTVHL
jgi:hypothetical protein